MPLAPKSFQDIITFSRASTGTYYNSSGYLTTAGILNYLTYSNTPENAAWNKQDSFVQTNLTLQSGAITTSPWAFYNGGNGAVLSAITAPDGTTTAIGLNDTSSAGYYGVTQTINIQTTTTYTFSAYVKQGTNTTGFSIWLVGNNSNIYFQNTISWISGVPTASGWTVTSVGNGWYRLSYTFASLTSTNVAVYFLPAPTALAETGSTYFWGAQLVQGAVPGDYQATTAAALPVLYADWTGALTARKICQNAAVAVPHGLRQNPTNLTGSTVYTLSFYAKAGESTKANAWQFSGAVFTTTAHATYDLVAGTATGDGSPTIQSVGNGWYRCTKTLTTVASPAAGTIHIGPTDAAGNQVYNGDGTSGVYITDMQIEVGTTVGPYYETTASQYNAPRFDYDPATLQLRGLLVEEQRANLLLRSSDYATSWTASRATVTSNAALSPDGTATANKLVATAVLGSHRIYQNSITNSGTTTKTLSAYFKAAEYSYAGLMLADSTESDQVRVQWNLATGASTVAPVGTTITLVSSSMQNLSNGWVRCIMTCTVDASEPIISAWLFVIDNANATSFTGDGVSGVYAWGAQCETGAFATSYIPTVASQVTRAVDSVFLNTLSPWFNQRTGTLYISGSYYSAITAAGTRGGFVGSGPYASANSINIFNSGGATTLDTYFTSITYPDVNLFRPLTTTANAVNRIAYGYNQNNGIYGLSVNASAVTTATSTQNTATFTSIALGRRDASTSNLLNGHIQRFTYYPRRLTDAELQAITT